LPVHLHHKIGKKKTQHGGEGGGVHKETLQLRASIYNIHEAFGIVVRRGESNHGLAIYIKFFYLEAKEKSFKIFITL